MNYQKLTLVELKALCTDYNIKYHKNIKKNELINLLTEYDCSINNNSNTTIVYIKTLMGSIREYEVNPNITIANFKSLISEDMDIPVGKLRLRILLNKDTKKKMGDGMGYGMIARMTDDNDILSSYNLEINNTFELTLSLLG
jgi:hypothetical protein